MPDQYRQEARAEPGASASIIGHLFDVMIHLMRRPFAAIAIDQLGGNADRGAAGGDVMFDQRAGADPGEVADADVAENRGPRAEQDTAADPGGAVRQRGPAADGDVLQDRGVVADDGERADDDAGGMIEEYRRSNRGRTTLVRPRSGSDRSWSQDAP
jgi:hypothetical protein